MLDLSLDEGEVSERGSGLGRDAAACADVVGLKLFEGECFDGGYGNTLPVRAGCLK